MIPAWAEPLRRHWQLAAILLVFAGLSAAHALVYRPALARYQRAARQAAELGVPLDPAGAAAPVSARVAALLEANSLNAAVAEEQGTSGALAAGLLDELTQMAARRGLEVLLTEQGLVTQLPGVVHVRARVKMRGRLAAFTDLLDDMAGSGILYAADRFTIQPGPGAVPVTEAWVSQTVLKRRAGER